MLSGNDIELARTNSHEMRHPKIQRRHGPLAASIPFAGRIGGNQEFTVDPSDASLTDKKLPDAGPIFTWGQSFSLHAFADVDLWKAAFIEYVGTCLQTYLSGLASIGLGEFTTKTSLGPVAPALFGALTNLLLISLFIFAGAPVSGGHFNPLITMSTFFARLSIFPRAILYILFQCAGAVTAGYLVRSSLGMSPVSLRVVPGCFVDPLLVTPRQA